MDHYKCYSTTNMVDWEYHGIILSAKDLIWGNPNEGFMCYAAYKNGKYYLYFPQDLMEGWSCY